MTTPRSSRAPGMFAPNPLYDALPAAIPLAGLAARLRCDPLSDLGVDDPAGLADSDKERLRGRLRQLFVPRPEMLEVADVVSRMIRDGYDRRNPMQLAQRRSIAQLAMSVGKPLADWPTFERGVTAGLTIRGITGLGKTACMNRVLGLLPQVIEHGPNEEAGWSYQKQLVWLHVELPHDSSRGGLLSSILLAIDHALGTMYSREFRHLTVERAAGQVGLVLARHYCGVLVLDELQRLSQMGSPQQCLLSNFFLRLMNWGVPVVLVGNPMGFAELDANAQTARRISSEGDIRFHPAACGDDKYWAGQLLPAMWRYVLMPEPSPLTEEIKLALWSTSGGIPGLAAKVIVGAQQLALRHDERTLTAQRIRDYYEQKMHAERNLVTGFATHNPALLAFYPDVPAKDYALMWGVNLDRALEDLKSSNTSALDSAVRGGHPEPRVADPYRGHRRNIARKAAAATRRDDRRREAELCAADLITGHHDDGQAPAL